MASRRAVSLAHITDAHVTGAHRPTAVLKHRTAEILQDLIAQINERGVDLTLFGGDNIDNRGTGPDDLRLFMSLTERLSRFVCIYGNHEADFGRHGRLSKEEFASWLSGHGISPGYDTFSEVVGNVRVIGIDTTLMGTPGGYVAPQTMSFLAREIRDAEEEHVIVLGHHLLYRAWEPYVLQSWDDEYLVTNRADVIALLASSPRVRAYLCGHHHASRIQRIAARGQSGGFYHVATCSPAAFPHRARVLRFEDDGIHVEYLEPRLAGIIDEGREAVLHGRKARRYATLGTSRTFLQYVEGRHSDNQVILPYDKAPVERTEHGDRRVEATL